MKEKFLKIFIVILGLIFFQCNQTNEPSGEKVQGITETGVAGPDYFIGTIDLNDWDPSSYEHLTVKEDYWINISLNDTIGTNSQVGLNNTSISGLYFKVKVSSPFYFSNDSIYVAPHSFGKTVINIDTTLIGLDSLIIGKVTMSISDGKKFEYTSRWMKPKPREDTISVVREGLNLKDQLLPAYPNPGDGSFRINFSIKKGQVVKLFVLNSNLGRVATLIDEYKSAGSYSYGWMEGVEEKAKYNSGIYRIMMQTDTYSKSGDVLLQK